MGDPTSYRIVEAEGYNAMFGSAIFGEKMEKQSNE